MSVYWRFLITNEVPEKTTVSGLLFKFWKLLNLIPHFNLITFLCLKFFRYFLSCFSYFSFVRLAEFSLFLLHYSSFFLTVPSFFAHFWMFTVTVYMFSCCTLFMLHFFRVAVFMYCTISCRTFARYSVLVLHSSLVAL